MLRTQFQMRRSGQFGPKSLSSSLRRPFQRWLIKAGAGMFGPKLICIDLQPYTTALAPDRGDIFEHRRLR